MNKFLTLTCALLSCAVARTQVQFERTYPKQFNQNINDVRECSSGGYIAVGFTVDSTGKYLSYVMRTDVNGDTTWTRTISGGYGQVAFNVQEADSGNFMITGYKNTSSSSDCDVHMIKLDPLGNVTLDFQFGGAGCQWGQVITRCADGNYAIGGSEFYKRTASGAPIWGRGWQGFQVFGLQQTSDGGFILEGANTSGFCLRKTDTAGVAVWTKTFTGDNFNPSCRTVAQTSDGGYILTAANATFTSVKLIKTDQLGDTVWTKSIGNWSYTYGGAVQQTNDGGYIITGEAYDGNIDAVYLVKTDAQGDTMWTRTFEHANAWCWGESVQQTLDGGYIIGASSRDSVTHDDDFYLIKTGPAGYLSTNTSIATPYSVNVFPNPFHDAATIYISSAQNINAVLHLYDILGNEVRTEVIPGKETRLEKEMLAPGCYFYSITNSTSQIAAGRIIIQ